MSLPSLPRARLIGIVSRSDFIKPSLALFDEEQRREKFRRVSFGVRRE